MLSIFINTRLQGLLRFDVEEGNEQKLPVGLGFMACAIYESDARTWRKNTVSNSPESVEDSAARTSFLDAHVTPDDLVAEPHHTFFKLRGLLWHMVTDNRLARDVRGYAFKWVTSNLSICLNVESSGASRQIDRSLFNILQHGGNAHCLTEPFETDGYAFLD